MGGPGLLYGGVGVALAMTLQMVGLFKQGDARFKNWLLEPVFHGNMPDTLVNPALFVITAVFCLGLAFAILDSVGTWRRVVLGVTMVVITIAMVPTFAVWQVYFSPFVLLVGIFWTWFCTMMYVNHHTMPCEHHDLDFEVTTVMHDVVAKPVRAERAQSVKKELQKEPHKHEIIQPSDPDAKYKPKVKSAKSKKSTKPRKGKK